jgi:hypothetical protein
MHFLRLLASACAGFCTVVGAVAVAAQATDGAPPRDARSCIDDMVRYLEIVNSPDYSFHRDARPFWEELAERPACQKGPEDRLPGTHYPPPDDQISGIRPIP